MNYNILSKNNIYIAFSEGDTFISKSIRWFTKSIFSHSFVLYWDDKWNMWTGIGDNWNGWLIEPASFENTITVALLPVDLWVGLRKNKNNLGSFYDYLGLIGMIGVMIGKFVFKNKKQWHNLLDVKNKFFCSEICTKIIQDSGLPLNLIPSSTDPQSLYNALKAIPTVKFIEG